MNSLAICSHLGGIKSSQREKVMCVSQCKSSFPFVQFRESLVQLSDCHCFLYCILVNKSVVFIVDDGDTSIMSYDY